MSTYPSRKSQNHSVKFNAMLDKHSDEFPSSRLDIKSIETVNRQRLFNAFLPDIQRTHAQMGYKHKVLPFSIAEQRLKTVQIIRRPLLTSRPVPEAPRRLPQGFRAANEVEPRPKWFAKPLPVNEKLYINPNEVYTTYVRRYPWIYREHSRVARSEHYATPRHGVTTKAHSDSSYLLNSRVKTDISRELQSAPGNLEHGDIGSIESGMS